MLEQTFLHLPGVGAMTERKLWEHGIRSWADLEAVYQRQYTLFENLSRDKRLIVLRQSREALDRKDACYFAERLPQAEHYRIAASFPNDTVFLDIETTGLSFYYDRITLIGVSRTDQYECHIAGTRNTRWRDLLSGAKCLVTFNGVMFDLKFLAKEFPDLHLPEAHVDLRFLGRRVGLRGPQKTIEQELQIERGKNLKGISGVDAALLWFEYKSGNIDAGERLVQYNHADIEGMKAILDEAIKRIGERGGSGAIRANGLHFAKFESTIKFGRSRRPAEKNALYVPKFRGRKGPLVNFDDLAKASQLKSLRVVGIDLTGSARRPSGWCVLHGRRAETRLVGTDKEIIAATVEASPDVVSIDSPLSLPIGRRTVRDTDRGRDKYGITRECERILRGRGVSVYPCLIPSMQALTARGMKLAKKLRALGLPVIESYPGAAQDIMNIPRKRASLEQLKEGLHHFGVSGEFLTNRVSHDELDAITSAIVGLFHWSGKFEALGNDKEDYLIIPDLHKTADEWRNRRVVGISGPIAAGKTTAAKYLESKGFAYGRYSMVLADLLAKEGREADRVNLQKIGDQIHRRPGQRWLNEQLFLCLPGGHDLVIDGLRWPEDHTFWVERFGPAFVHVHVDAPIEVRKQRYVNDGHSAGEFEQAITHPVEEKVPVLKDFANVIVTNQRSLTGLKGNLSKAINQLFSARGMPCQPRSS